MDIVPSVVNGLIAAVAVAFVMYITRQQYRDLKEGLRDLKEGQKDLRSELASVRSDLTQVALAVGTQLRPQTG